MSTPQTSVVAAFGRIANRLRGSRSAGPDHRLAGIGTDLAPVDVELLRKTIDEALDSNATPEAARARAAEIGAAYLGLGTAGQQRFFELLATEYGTDESAVTAAIAQREASAPASVERVEADTALRKSLEPARIRLLRYFNGLDTGVKFLVDLRADIRALPRTDHTRLVDAELRDLLASWFDVGLLRLDRVTWDTSAAVLEKLIEYEAVHDIASWDDLKRRLAPDRRLYAFFHPGMPEEPLIFVEVALTTAISDNISPLLDPLEPEIDPDDATTAIFYSISNCQPGLAGVPLGDFLIKRVVREVQPELPNIETFSTLSPMPGFHRWVSEQIEAKTLRGNELAIVAAVVETDKWWMQLDIVEAARPALIGLAARYLLTERSNGRVVDPVARFHLANGARVERLLFLANRSDVGQERGLAMMVNYRYVPDRIDENQQAYLLRDEVVASDAVRDLLVTRDE